MPTMIKNLLKVTILSASMLTFIAAPSMKVLAQDVAAQDAEAKAALYKKFLDNYKGTDDQKKTANDAAKEYVEKYSSDTTAENVTIVKYLQGQIKKYDASINEKKNLVIYDRYNAALKAKNAAGVFTETKNIIAIKPDDATLTSVLLNTVDVGYTQTSAKPAVDTYNADTITFAKQVIQKIEGGVKLERYAPYDDKNSALAWMNNIIGYIESIRNKKRTEGATFYYKAIQPQSSIKTFYYPYTAIALKYEEDYTKATEEYKTKYVDTKTFDTDEAKKLVGTYKAIADRGIDAYARAYTFAKNDKAVDAATRKAIYSSLTDFHTARFGKDKAILNDAFIASVVAKPMPDPNSAVVPVLDAVPTTTPTTTTSTVTTPTADNTGTSRPRTSATTTTTPTTPTAPVKATANGTTATKPATTKAPTTATKPVKRP